MSCKPEHSALIQNHEFDGGYTVCSCDKCGILYILHDDSSDLKTLVDPSSPESLEVVVKWEERMRQRAAQGEG